MDLAWFSAKDNADEMKSFVEIIRNVHNIILNEAQPPARS